MNIAVGVDLGGTKIAAAAVAADGTVGIIRQVLTPALEGPATILDAVAALVSTVARKAPESLCAVGVGTAGVVDTSRGTIVSATDAIMGWAGTDIVREMNSRLGRLLGHSVPVFVENDVDAHARGETWIGAAAGISSVLMVAVGTGVGGSIVLDGHPLRGVHHVAGEMGHMPASGADGLRCTCGRIGHLEAIGSGPGLHRRYLALGGDPGCVSTRGVFELADRGDGLATQAIRDSAGAVGRATAGIVTVFDPEVVIVGGGLVNAGSRWWNEMERAFRAELIDALTCIPMLPAGLGDSSAIVGAARGAWDLCGGSDAGGR